MMQSENHLISKQNETLQTGITFITILFPLIHFVEIADLKSELNERRQNLQATDLMVEEKLDEIRSLNKQKAELEKEYHQALSQLESTKLELENQIVTHETLYKTIETEHQHTLSELEAVKANLEKQIATNASLNEKIEEQEIRINGELKRLMVFS